MATQEKPGRIHVFFHRILPDFINILTLVLSLGLIIYISYDSFKGIDFTQDVPYMKYQLVVCCIFMAEYFYRIIIARHKIRFMFFAFPFLLISIPYFNIIQHYNIMLDQTLLYYLSFIPILRGLVALVFVVNFVTENISTTVFVSYALVLLPVVYMSALIFLQAEQPINPDVKNFWYALWWACMTFTTIGCYINPMTATGMVLGVVLSLLGIIMLPLFTVYFGQVVQTYSKKVKAQKKE